MRDRALRAGLGVMVAFMLGAWTSLPVRPEINAPILQISQVETPLFLGSIDDWEIWELKSSGTQICYVMSASKSRVLDNVHDSIPVVQVTRVPREPVVNEVSIVLGYRHTGSGAVGVEVDGVSFQPFTQENPHPTDENEEGDEDTFEKVSRAWVADDTLEQALFKAMRAGNVMTVSGRTPRGKIIKDRFSLIGLTRAHRIMSDRCSGKWPDLRAIKPERRNSWW